MVRRRRTVWLTALIERTSIRDLWNRPHHGGPRNSRLLLAFFVAALAAEHLLQPALDPEQHRISEYANGSPGWLMTAGFVAWALSLATTAHVVGGSELWPRTGRTAVCALLAVAAGGALVTALFNTGTSAGLVPAGRHLTTGNHLHDAGSGVLALALWGAALGSLLVHERLLRAWVVGVLMTSVACTVALSAAGLPGVEQRALVLLACVWQWALLAAVGRVEGQSLPGT